MGKKRIAVEKMTEGDVLDALATTHPSPEQWVFLRHVGDATGFKHSRTADAMAMGCWGSVGIHLHGYEVKVSRSDWLREIQQTNKAVKFIGHCHYWWIAAPDGVVDLAEMPAEWGLKIVTKTENGWTVRVKKAATLNQNPTLSYSFFASALRNCYRAMPGREEMEKALRDRYAAGVKDGVERKDTDYDRRQIVTERDQLAKWIDDFQKASGIDLTNRRWPDGEDIGTAVKSVLKGGTAANRLRKIEQVAEGVLKNVRDAINEVGVGEPVKKYENWELGD